MSIENYEKYKVYELKKLCKERYISGYSKKKKDELINILEIDNQKKSNFSTDKNYSKYKVYELKQMCKERNINGYSKKRKEELIKMLDDEENKENFSLKYKKGSQCSVEGKKYEKVIYNIVKKCTLNKIKFNTQKENELGGCNNKNDIECNYKGERNIPIEIKKSKSPDWMQCSINYDKKENRWIGSAKNKIPDKSKKIFENLLSNKTIFNGKIPPFQEKNITHKEWLEIKKNCNDFDDIYISCSNDIIKKLYREKGCYYIQISEKGLYHLGEDICNFKVPEFLCEQQLRIRTKIHTRENNKGFCNLSITLACQPKNIKNLIESPFSLDDVKKLPKNLIYKHELNKMDKSLLSMKKDQLIDKCKELGLTNYATKNKSELAKMIENFSKEIKINNVSPLRYPGGKTRACKILDNIVSKNFELESFDTLLSPFFGGGSFEFFFQNKYNYKLCVNDKFQPLFNFWDQIKKNKSELCNELKKIKIVNKEEFVNYRKEILNNENKLQQALQYFIINRCSFSGATLSGGFSEESSKKRFTTSSIDKISKLNLSYTDVYNYDFEYFINNYCNEKCLMFLDPPYYLEKKSKLYGTNGDLHENFNHEKLYEIIKDKKNWILTYNNCEFIRDLYKDYIIIDADWSYGMNKSKLSSEIIIISK